MVDDKKSEFGDAEKVTTLTKDMQDVEDKRASDRMKINRLFNGGRPYTKEEQEKNQIQINVNWGEGKRIMLDANRQLNNALLHPGILFNCTLQEGRVDKRGEWSQKFTKNIHRPIQKGKSGKRHLFTIQNRNTTVCMHGIGALLWPNDFSWLGRFVPLEDLLIPTNTYCDLSNLRYFAVNLYLTPGELVDMTQRDKSDRGWNQKMVRELLDEQKKMFSESIPSTWRDQPEAMRQVFDQNRGYYYSDAIPTIKLRAFFYHEIDEPEKWYRVYVLREGVGKVGTKDFIYDGSDKPFADEIEHILNIQYGDGNLVAPKKYHSTRGLGVDLFAPVEQNNRTRCEFVAHVSETMKMYFRKNDLVDRDQFKEIFLSQFTVLPKGLEIVPQDQRHQIDIKLVEEAMAQMRQLMQESSASFVQNANTDAKGDMTAFEANARIQSANVMISGMLGNMYLQEGFYYQELVRRFCQKNSNDPEVKEFQKRCIEDGIPQELLKAECWDVVPERVLGGGDRVLAQQQAGWLVQNRTLYDPTAQTTILRTATATILDNWDLAQTLVPSAPVTVTEGTMAAENVFGTLMTGNATGLRQGIDHIGYIETMLKMMGNVIQRISQTDNVGTVDDLIGLQTVAQNVVQQVMIVAGDEKEKPRVKQYGDALGKMMNDVKGFAQRLQQANQAKAKQAQGDPKAAAQAEGTVMMAKVKATIAAQNNALKQKHKDIAFQLDEQRKNLEAMSDMKREDMLHQHNLVNDSARQTIEMLRELKMIEAKSKMTDSGE
jgi:hypothetical protein